MNNTNMQKLYTGVGLPLERCQLNNDRRQLNGICEIW